MSDEAKHQAPRVRLISHEPFRIGCARLDRVLPHRDIETKAATPRSFSLQPFCPPAYNQLQLGSCTANALCHILLMLSGKCGVDVSFPPDFEPSRMFVYTEERMLESGGQIQDDGANVADGFAIITSIGVCEERCMPYVPANFGSPPSAEALSNAAEHKYPQSEIIAVDPDVIKTCVSQRIPVALALWVFPSFMTESVANDGVMPVPSADELSNAAVGGHEVCVVGFTDTNLICLNSWGVGWGKQGFFSLPLELFQLSYLGNPVLMQAVILGAVPEKG